MFRTCVALQTRSELLEILLNIESGTHLDKVPGKTLVIPCRAFRLEPFSAHTEFMTVDGEVIPYEPIQASVTPIRVRVMCSEPAAEH